MALPHSGIWDWEDSSPLRSLISRRFVVESLMSWLSLRVCVCPRKSRRESSQCLFLYLWPRGGYQGTGKGTFWSQGAPAGLYQLGMKVSPRILYGDPWKAGLQHAIQKKTRIEKVKVKNTRDIKKIILHTVWLHMSPYEKIWEGNLTFSPLTPLTPSLISDRYYYYFFYFPVPFHFFLYLSDFKLRSRSQKYFSYVHCTYRHTYIHSITFQNLNDDGWVRGETQDK